jgi:3-deoxy-manno-octulosonate cytidylyltransferase (CMP-KDO synthetase)
MASTRLPGKPLATLLGMTMIEHVYRRSVACEDLDAVVIATCDEEIRLAAEGFGAPVAMTSDRHERASDRMAEVARTHPADIYVLIQGDEPLIRPEMIAAAVRPLLEDPTVGCSNLSATISSEEEFNDPNVIKVVTDLEGDALLMSRRPIPSQTSGDLSADKQVCVIPFRKEMLTRYAALEPTPLEKVESIDMLRLLEHGLKVRMVATDVTTHAVDTEADRALVEAMLASDPFTRSYLDV